MVCLGNICRSPLAHGILQDMIDKEGLDWEVDSCGTSGFHDGELPDRRSIEVARSHNIDITDQRSRQLIKHDTKYYDLILAMDQSNFNNIRSIADPEDYSKIEMILNYLYPGQNRRVPDPYYEGGFSGVYDMLYDACQKIVEKEREV